MTYYLSDIIDIKIGATFFVVGCFNYINASEYCLSHYQQNVPTLILLDQATLTNISPKGQSIRCAFNNRNLKFNARDGKVSAEYQVFSSYEEALEFVTNQQKKSQEKIQKWYLDRIYQGLRNATVKNPDESLKLVKSQVLQISEIWIKLNGYEVVFQDLTKSQELSN